MLSYCVVREDVLYNVAHKISNGVICSLLSSLAVCLHSLISSSKHSGYCAFAFTL
jgi:hypothetical protein